MQQLEAMSDRDEDGGRAPPNAPRSNLGRCLSVGAISALSVVCAFMFLQLQALSLSVASEQRQIDELKRQIESSATEIEQQVEKQHDLTIVNIAGTFTLLSCLVTMFHMTAHLRKMNQPAVQRKILAILWMSPVYGLTSFLSLLLPPCAEYLAILKDFYESYVIYQFLSFLVAVLGRGDRNAVVACLARRADHLRPPYRCLGCLFHPPPEEGDGAMANAVLLECQFLAMQFVFVRPATAIATFVLDATGVGAIEGGSKWAYFYSPQFFVMMVENASVFLAFSGLLKFYHAVRDDLAWCQPFAKFMTIKGVVFMTFWQGLSISIFFHASKDGSGEEESASESDGSVVTAKSIQNILICMEMLFFSVAHWCVFPAEEWEDGYRVRFYEGPGFGFRDFKDDVSMMIDSGKRSMKARRERRVAEKEDCPAMNGSDAGTSPMFGSMDEAAGKSEEESVELPLV